MILKKAWCFEGHVMPDVEERFSKHVWGILDMSADGEDMEIYSPHKHQIESLCQSWNDYVQCNQYKIQEFEIQISNEPDTLEQAETERQYYEGK